MKFQFFLRRVAHLIGALVALAFATPALADETVRLTLVHEQALETDMFEEDVVTPLIRLCGNVGFLYVSREEGGEGRWFLHRIADGSSTDVGLRYNEQWPIECSADGRWATTSRWVNTSPDRLVSLVDPGSDELLSVADGLMYWSHVDDAAILVIDWTGHDGGIVYPSPLNGLEVLAAEAAPGSIATRPIWVGDGRIIVAIAPERSIKLVELPSDAIRLEASDPTETLPDLGRALSNGLGTSLVHSINWSDAEAIDLQAIGGAVLIQQYPVPIRANRLFCEDEGEWECNRVSVEPMADIVRVYYPRMALLDATGRLFWIERRGGEFCPALATVESEHGRCVYDGALSMFSDIRWYGVSPDRSHLFVVGSRADDDEAIVAVFELAIVPAE